MAAPATGHCEAFHPVPLAGGARLLMPMWGEGFHQMRFKSSFCTLGGMADTEMQLYDARLRARTLLLPHPHPPYSSPL